MNSEKLALANRGYQDGRAGREPLAQFKAHPVYMQSYRRGKEARDGD